MLGKIAVQVGLYYFKGVDSTIVDYAIKIYNELTVTYDYDMAGQYTGELISSLLVMQTPKGLTYNNLYNN